MLKLESCVQSLSPSRFNLNRWTCLECYTVLHHADICTIYTCIYTCTGLYRSNSYNYSLLLVHTDLVSQREKCKNPQCGRRRFRTDGNILEDFCGKSCSQAAQGKCTPCQPLTACPSPWHALSDILCIWWDILFAQNNHYARRMQRVQLSHSTHITEYLEWLKPWCDYI